MPYFNYHGRAKKLIREGHLINCEIRDWNGIQNALVLYFDNARPMPIRPERAAEYAELLNKAKGTQ